MVEGPLSHRTTYLIGIEDIRLGVGNGSVVSMLDFHPASRGSSPSEREKRPITITIQELS